MSGAVTLVSLILMLIEIYRQTQSTLYYAAGGVCIAFGLVFVLTAFIFLIRSVVWHIQNKRVRYLIRHYLYAIVAVYLALMVFDHITGGISWVNNAMYSPLLALGEIYLSGYRLQVSETNSPKTVTVG